MTQPVEAGARTQASRLQSQKRASFALDRVHELRELPSPSQADYRRQAEGFPAMVRAAGAGQAVAFLLKSESPGSQALHRHVREWLTDCGHTIEEGKEGLIQALVTASRADYLRMQEEIVLFCGWVKTFAQAFLQGGRGARPEDQDAPSPGGAGGEDEAGGARS